MNNRQREETRTLELLQAIEQRSDVTQRHLAHRMGVALGLANSYLKRCARKGLIKVQQAPANRYLYYLTPKGFAEKSRLTAEYLSFSLSFYRRASESCACALVECRQAGIARLGLYGASDLAEIAALRALEQGVEVGCLCDSRAQRPILSIPLVRSIPEAPSVDAWMVTDLTDPQGAYEALAEQVGESAVRAPCILGISRTAVPD